MVVVWASGTDGAVVAVLSNEAGETAGSLKLGGVRESGKKANSNGALAPDGTDWSLLPLLSCAIVPVTPICTVLWFLNVRQEEREGTNRSARGD